MGALINQVEEVGSETGSFDFVSPSSGISSDADSAPDARQATEGVRDETARNDKNACSLFNNFYYVFQYNSIYIQYY